MTEQIEIIEIKDWKGRVILLALIAAAIAFAWFSISWQMGNMLASLTPANDPNTKQIADFAQTLSPRDPITNWLKANVEKDVFTPESLAHSVTGFEQTVRTAPNDYRYWIELGRVYEQTEQFGKAEKAFLEAVKLAPNYSVTHWQIGNFYLRQGRETEAFTELRKSAESSALYGEQVFSIIWEYFDKDTAKLEQLAGENADVRAGLTKFYAVKELPEDSLRIWDTLSAEDKQRNQAVTRIIAQSLYEKRYFRSSIEFVRQLGIEPQAQAENVQNGGFESLISAEARDVYFGWKVYKLEKVDVNTDPLKKKEGYKSLRVSFNGYAGIGVKNIWQIVTTVPNKKYRLSFWLKTENLKSAGTPDLEIVNANDEKIITTGAPFPTGTTDWTQVSIEFTAPENAEAIVIRLDRAYCGDACPIVGTIWLDDFKLQSN